MTKISSKSAYPKKNPISDDYFVGTDSENFGKTVNFGFEATAGLINKLNGTPILNYVFNTSPYIDTEVLVEGQFLSLASELNTPELTKLYVNKFNNSGDNLGELYLFLKDNATDFYLKLRNSNNQNNVVYFNIASIESFQDYFILNISVFKENEFFPLLQNLNVYFFDFELKAVSAGSDPLKLDKSTYTGNAQDLDTRIDALEAVTPSDYALIVYVNANLPSAATIFDIANPPIANNNTLKDDENNLYIGVDLSTWTYNTLLAVYETKSISPTSNFYLSGTTTDAGSNKASAIKRGGTIEADGFMKTGSTAGDVLLGDGSTVLLTSIGGDESTSNKSQDVETDKLSVTKYPSVKALYDWAVGKFQLALGFTPANDANVIHTTGDETKAGSLTVNDTGEGVGVQGNSTDGTGVYASSQNGSGVFGISTSGSGVKGSSGSGLAGEFDAILGTKIASFKTNNVEKVFISTDGTITASAASTSSQVVIKSQLDTKQDTLVSGTNIKTINGTSILGSGNMAVGSSVQTYTAYVDALGNDATGVIGNDSSPFLTIDAALDAMGANKGRIMIGIGTFASPTKAKIKTGISFYGSGKPTPNNTTTISSFPTWTNTTPTALVGGTIFQGTFDVPYNVDNITVRDLGVDVGSAFSGALDYEGLLFAQDYLIGAGGVPPYISSDGVHRLQTSTTLRKNVVIENVSVLLKNPTVSKHCILIENSIDPIVNNVSTYFGFAGLVIKSTGGIFSNIHAFGSGSYGIILKSDDYSYCSNVLLSNFTIGSITSNDGGGLMLSTVDPSSPGLSNCTIKNGVITDAKYGIKTEGTGGTAGFDDINVSGVKMTKCLTTGVLIANQKSCTFTNLMVRSSGSGINISGSSNIMVSNCRSDNNVGNGFTLAATVRITFDNLTANSNTGWGISFGTNVYGNNTSLLSNTSGGITGTYLPIGTAPSTTPLLTQQGSNIGINTTATTLGGTPGDLLIQGNTAGAGVGRIIVGGTGNYMDMIFAKTNASAQMSLWSFGTRYDTYFGNANGAFTIVGTHTDGTNRAPLFAQPNGDLILVGATANATVGNLGAGVIVPTSKLHTTSFATAYTATAVNLTLTVIHNVVVLTASGVTATLPTAVGITGRRYTVKLTASGTGTVATTSSQTIDGVTTYSLASQYKFVTVQSDGANWNIIGQN